MAEYPLHQLIRLGRLEIDIAKIILNLDLDVRIFSQGRIVTIVSLFLL